MDEDVKQKNNLFIGFTFDSNQTKNEPKYDKNQFHTFSGLSSNGSSTSNNSNLFDNFLNHPAQNHAKNKDHLTQLYNQPQPNINHTNHFISHNQYQVNNNFAVTHGMSHNSHSMPAHYQTYDKNSLSTMNMNMNMYPKMNNGQYGQSYQPQQFVKPQQNLNINLNSNLNFDNLGEKGPKKEEVTASWADDWK